MTDGILTDEQIAALTPEQRRELVSRLKRPLGEVIDPEYLARMRRIRLSLMIGGSMAMIPWLGYLSVTLPENYVAHNWPITWIGFDVLLVGFMLATAVLGYLRRQLLGLAAFTTGVLLICDAWFDLMTAGPKDVWLSVITALLIEVPLAVFMILSALRITRLTMMRLWLLRPGMRLWDLPLFPDGPAAQRSIVSRVTDPHSGIGEDTAHAGAWRPDQGPVGQERLLHRR